MSEIMKTAIQERLIARTLDHAQNLSTLHSQMLALRGAGLAQLAGGIGARIGAGEIHEEAKAAPLFNKDWLNTFATGDITRCLGQDYAIYQNRRCPRIPNGDLLLMSRIVSIQGERGNFAKPARISAELDVPADAWYFNASPNGVLPVSIMLEIALQPCGVLSAWLGTQLRFPAMDFYFRNLDGDVRYSRAVDARGRTIGANAVLTRTVFSGTTIIQHFDFNLVCEGESFFSGSSSFGYFPEESMAAQIGMDGGKPSLPWGRTAAGAGKLQQIPAATLAWPNLPASKLRLIEVASVHADGGSQSLGYVLADRRNDPADWFYANHFFQDPVMPGSLGIEAIVQALKAGAPALETSAQTFSLAPGTGFQWKYRGQVLPTNRTMSVDAHITSRTSANGKNSYTASASLWADDMRIYEATNLTIQQD